MALTIKSSALTGRIVPFFISSCSDRSSRLIANDILRILVFPCINKGSSGLAVKRSKCANETFYFLQKAKIITREKKWPVDLFLQILQILFDGNNNAVWHVHQPPFISVVLLPENLS